MNRPLVACLICFAAFRLFGCGPAPAEDPAPGTSIGELTGARTRVVWCRQVVGSGDDPFGTGNHFVLMGLDSRDPAGERIILSAVSNYRKPMLAPDGERIVFTNLPEKKVYIVRWDGSGLRPLVDGMALEVWGDPETETAWVYYVSEVRDNDTLDGFPLRRCPLDRPAASELVWDRTDITADNFQLSADGRYAAGLFPWKDAAWPTWAPES